MHKLNNSTLGFLIKMSTKKWKTLIKWTQLFFFTVTFVVPEECQWFKHASLLYGALFQKSANGLNMLHYCMVPSWHKLEHQTSSLYVFVTIKSENQILTKHIPCEKNGCVIMIPAACIWIVSYLPLTKTFQCFTGIKCDFWPFLKIEIKTVLI